MKKGPQPETRQQQADRQTKALAGLALVIAVAVMGFFLFQHLKAEGELEDCLLARRTNCDALMQR